MNPIASAVRKVQRFILLYLYARERWNAKEDKSVPKGIRASLRLRFYDPQYPKTRHGVMAFVLKHGTTPDEYYKDVFGPMGYSSEITLKLGDDEFHLYGWDGWGIVQDYQLRHNPSLRKLQAKHPHSKILLVGVRHLGPFAIPPLHNPASFVLVRK